MTIREIDLASLNDILYAHPPTPGIIGINKQTLSEDWGPGEKRAGPLKAD